MDKNKPDIRFNGYQDEWKEKTLGEMGKPFNGLSGKTKDDFGHGEASFITYMNVFSNPVASPSGIDNVEIDKSQNEVKKGDILFTTSSETPEEVGMSSVWLHDRPNTYLNSFCFGLRPEIEIDPYFSAYLMRSPEVRKDFYFLAQGISRFNISKQKAMDIKTTIPDTKEQQKIGDFFRNLDELIEAKEQELEKLRQIKMALLDGMFPSDEQDKSNRGGYNELISNMLHINNELQITKSTAKSPAIRFRGFTEPWKTDVLHNVFDFNVPHNSLSRDKLNYKKGSILNIHYGDILVEFDSVVDVCNENIPYITNGTFSEYKHMFLSNGYVVFADTAEDRTVGKVIEICNVNDKYIVPGLHTISAKPLKTFAKYYLGYFFNSSLYHNQLIPLMQGVKVLSVNKTALENTTIYFPDNFAEQEKIGNFFKEQDENIRSAQLQINKLRNIKQACMQKMFA